MSILENFRGSRGTNQKAKPATTAPTAPRRRTQAPTKPRNDNAAEPSGLLGTRTKQPERFLQPYYAVDIGETTYQLPLAIVLTQGALGLEAMLYANDLYDYTEPLADRGKKLILVSHQISSYLRERGSDFKAHYEEGRAEKRFTHEAKDDKFTEYYALANLVQKFGNERGTQYIREAEKQAGPKTTINQVMDANSPDWRDLLPAEKDAFVVRIRRDPALKDLFLDQSSTADAAVNPAAGSYVSFLQGAFKTFMARAK